MLKYLIPSLYYVGVSFWTAVKIKMLYNKKYWGNKKKWEILWYLNKLPVNFYCLQTGGGFDRLSVIKSDVKEQSQQSKKSQEVTAEEAKKDKPKKKRTPPKWVGPTLLGTGVDFLQYKQRWISNYEREKHLWNFKRTGNSVQWELTRVLNSDAITDERRDVVEKKNINHSCMIP